MKYRRDVAQGMELRSTDGVEAAFKAGSSAGIKAMVNLGSPEFARARSTESIAAIAASNRWPEISPFRKPPNESGPVSYRLIRGRFAPRAGVLIGKILNGAQPGDLPIEPPTRFAFVIKPKVAKALDITVPRALLLRADEVIQ